MLAVGRIMTHLHHESQPVWMINSISGSIEAFNNGVAKLVSHVQIFRDI
jgi:hypothetical protein